jgi:hypothetical protein
MGFLEWLRGDPQVGPSHIEVGKTRSYDWCRFRRNQHCFFTDILDEEATQGAGYRVYVPVDRGFCPRIKWAAQQQCSASAPGPNVPGGYIDATVPWEAGGQRLHPTKAAVDYIPTFSTSNRSMGSGGPTPLEATGVPAAASPSALTPERTRTLGVALLALRTAGVLSSAEYALVRSRISGVPPRLDFTAQDLETTPLERLNSLREAELLSDTEFETYRARI